MLKKIDNYVSTLYPVLEQILYNIAVYRMIKGNNKTENEIIKDYYQHIFWENTSNNAIQMAIMDWCKVFGSRYNNSFHYMNHMQFVIEEENQVKESMTRFRNKYIAHKTETEVPVPVLDGAIEFIYCFDYKLREEYDLDGYPDLKSRYESYLLQIEDMIKKFG